MGSQLILFSAVASAAALGRAPAVYAPKSNVGLRCTASISKTLYFGVSAATRAICAASRGVCAAIPANIQKDVISRPFAHPNFTGVLNGYG